MRGQFSRLHSQIDSMHDEFSALMKKNPDATLNAFKVSTVNNLLKAANKALGTSKLPFEGFEAFDSQTLPSVSDVSMILGGYKTALWSAHIDQPLGLE